MAMDWQFLTPVASYPVRYGFGLTSADYIDHAHKRGEDVDCSHLLPFYVHPFINNLVCRSERPGFYVPEPGRAAPILQANPTGEISFADGGIFELAIGYVLLPFVARQVMLLNAEAI